ncbi:MAG: hypothetical protein K2L23_02775 [Odoribacter sp.]|nr:hypothetical protein [Odoribacter sp.]
MLSQIIEHNDANVMMDMATKAFEDEYRISDFQGIYTYDEITTKWEKQPAQNRVELHYNNTVLTIVCKDIKEYTKVDQTLIEVPATTSITLAVNGKTELVSETKIELSGDMYSVNIKSDLTLADNYVWAITASAAPEKATSTFKMTVKGEELINGNAELNGNQLTDPDYIDENRKDVFNTGKFDCQLMNVRLTGEGDIKAIIQGIDKIDEEDPWSSYYDEEKDKKNAETLKDLYNSYLKIQGFYVAEKQKFAEIKTGLYFEEKEIWKWDNEKHENNCTTVKDWDVQPILVFTDQSEMEFDSFFTETRFSSLISSVETLINKYMDMIGEEHIKL